VVATVETPQSMPIPPRASGAALVWRETTKEAYQ